MQPLQHEDACMLCDDDRDPPARVCCDACPRVAHISCLTPPLRQIPAGAWLCPRCQPVFSIEKILDVRTRFKVGVMPSSLAALHLTADLHGRKISDSITIRQGLGGLPQGL